MRAYNVAAAAAAQAQAQAQAQQPPTGLTAAGYAVAAG